MKFINKFIQLILFVTFVLLVYSLSVVGIFSSNQRLTKVLDDSGFYVASSKLMADELNKQINSSNTLLNEAIKNSITSSVTSDVAKSVIQPSQILLVEWLNNKQDKVVIDLDLLPIKNKVATKTSDNQVKFEITRLLPDNFQILAESKGDSGVMAQLNRAKDFYIFVKNSIFYLWVILGATALLLFVLNIRKGSKKLNSIFYPLMFASLFGLIIALLSSFASTSIGLDINTKAGLDNFQLLTKMTLAIIRDSFMVFAITAGASVVGIIISKAIFRGKDKHLKKTRKK